MDDSMAVEVVFFEAGICQRRQLSLPAGATVGLAIQQASLPAAILESISTAPIGIFSHRVTIDDALRAGDRIELYQPLLQDPMDARRNRARHQS